MMNRVQRLLQNWKNQGIKCPPGATLKTIADFESRNGVVLPADMREYFLTVNGMGPAQEVFDDCFHSFWRIEDVKSVSENCPEKSQDVAAARNYYIIADHSLHIETFAIRLGADCSFPTPVARVTLHEGVSVVEIENGFESFGQFLDTYLEDSEAIL